MARTHQFSQDLDLFYSCFETISPTLRFYIRLLISCTYYRTTRNSGKLNAITSKNIPQNFLIGRANEPIKRILIAHQTAGYIFTVLDALLGCVLGKTTV